ncbi:uncharacterized protein B0H18DRAFT_857153, partial [Fomitopsis serialis]|uniref:uncharacterized protein n=1 Tax=Fomitopsis serialis TaxID=139415 RepID=UPI00200772BE
SEVPADLVAAIYAVNVTPLDAPLHFLSPSDDLVELLFDKTPLWEDQGWIDVASSDYMRALLNRLRQRCAPTSFGKITTPHLWKALESARQYMSNALQPSLPQTGPIDLARDPRFDVSGARLCSLTQALAYKGIIAWTAAPVRAVTAKNIDALRTHNAASMGTLSDSALWTSLRHRDFSRAFSIFLWKSVHGALRCGPYWLKITNYTTRANCSFCGLLETPSHILFDCTATGQELIWHIIATLWKKKGLPWPAISILDVHSLGLKLWTDQKSRVRIGATRLWRILISEASHLIWKLRCERVIGHSDEPGWEHNDQQIRRRLAYTLNNRLLIDVAATQRKFEKLARNSELVIATWNSTIHDELALPDDW